MKFPWFNKGSWSLGVLCLRIIAVILVLLVCYLSLRSSSSMKDFYWLCRPIGEWADRHVDLRTGVPALMLSLYLSCELILQGHSRSRFLHWVIGANSIFLLFCLMEGIQYFLPHRTSSFWDVTWAAAGILLGSIPFVLVDVCSGLNLPAGKVGSDDMPV